MKRILLRSIVALNAVASAFAFTASAQAAVVVNVTQGLAGVDVSAVGSVDLTGLTPAVFNGFPLTNISNDHSIRGTPGYVSVGAGNTVSGFSGFTGPASFGTGTQLIAETTFIGNLFDLNSGSFGAPIVFLAPNYVSGSAIAGAASFANATIASLKLTAGSYVYKSSNDTITVNIGQPITAAVPEPATWAMMILGMGAVGFAMRSAKRRSDEKFDAKIKRITYGAAA